MDLEKEYKMYLISSKIKALQGKINSLGTDEDSGEDFSDLQGQIRVLTNLLEML